MVLDEAAVGRLFAEVTRRGLLSNTRSAEASETFGRSGGGRRAIVGELEVGDRRVELGVVLGSYFPHSLPAVFLVDRKALGFIPHVDPDGYVCYAASEGLVIDSTRPLEVIEYALARARTTLESGVSGENRADFTDEIASYWAKLPNVLNYESVLEPGVEAREILVSKTKKKQGVFANDMAELWAFHGSGGAVHGSYENLRALYIPLEPGTVLVPPEFGRMWSAEEVRAALLPNVSPENAQRISELTGGGRTKDTILVSVPRPSGGVSLIGIRADGMRARHVLRADGTADRLTPIVVERRDRSYLVPRGGGHKELQKKKVLVIGVGAVGGRVAFELARLGVLDLTLLDHDDLTAENTFRHVLGREFWGEPKVEAMKTAIESDLPFVRVTALVVKLQTFLEREAQERFPDGWDLVISATGNPTMELVLNRLLRAHDGSGPSRVFTWLEPLGIGGHALLIQPGQRGCLECLYTDADGKRRTHNRAAFAAAGQEFGRALTGCGSLHMPFGALDAMATAELATRLGADVLRGRARQESVLRSWRGDARDFRDAGFRLTERFGLSEATFRSLEGEFAVANCPVCGS